MSEPINIAPYVALLNGSAVFPPAGSKLKERFTHRVDGEAKGAIGGGRAPLPATMEQLDREWARILLGARNVYFRYTPFSRILARFGPYLPEGLESKLQRLDRRLARFFISPLDIIEQQVPDDDQRRPLDQLKRLFRLRASVDRLLRQRPIGVAQAEGHESGNRGVAPSGVDRHEIFSQTVRETSTTRRRIEASNRSMARKLLMQSPDPADEAILASFGWADAMRRGRKACIADGMSRAGRAARTDFWRGGGAL
jgi:hypothetical protein